MRQIFLIDTSFRQTASTQSRQTGDRLLLAGSSRTEMRMGLPVPPNGLSKFRAILPEW